MGQVSRVVSLVALLVSSPAVAQSVSSTAPAQTPAAGASAADAAASSSGSPVAPGDGAGAQSAVLPPVMVLQPKSVTPAATPAAPKKTPKPVAAEDDAPAPAPKKAANTKAKGQEQAQSGAGKSPPASASAGPSGTSSSTATATAGEADLGTGSASKNPVFTLGSINLVGGTTVNADQSWSFNRATLDTSANLAPGVTSSNTGGSRNERMIYVRGFDRWQVPLSIDGVRVYLPADNRLDFGRFLSADIEEVQIAKGYASVLDGPGGLGGAINLVTHRPVKPLEGELQGAMTFGRDGRFEGYRSYLSAGTRQSSGYLQASGTILDMDGWMMSGGFKPTASEDGGLRDHSGTRDWRVAVKAGLTPNATDEYAINYIKQSGSKGAPLHVSDPVGIQRYWDWPYWDVESVYALTSTRLGDVSYVNTKLYYNTFKNGLFSYDDAALTTQSLGKAFRSYYDDKAYGISVDAGTDLTPWDTLKGAVHVRRDDHGEWQDLYSTKKPCVANVPCSTEPRQTTLEDTYSVALENTLRPAPQLEWITGASYDWRNLQRAEDFAANAFVYYKLVDSNAFNWQSALVYHTTDSAKIYASLSHRTRFPTIFERFSSRFGGATSNPSLAPEVSTNYELGWADRFAPASQISTAVFYSDVSDFIQSVPFIYNGQSVTQSQNVGSGHFIGWELAADFQVSNSVTAGGNITLIRRDLSNPANPKFQMTGVPDAKGIAYVTWRPVEALRLTPSVEWAANRWTVNTSGTVYYKTGAYTLVNIDAEYDVAPGSSIMLSARNVLDASYTLTDGFPEAGRSFTAAFRTRF